MSELSSATPPPRSKSWRRLGTTAGIFVLAWVITLGISCWVTHRQAGESYLRNPQFCLDLRYVHQLNQLSRKTQNERPRILFFGDSTIFGMLNRTDETTLQAAFEKSFTPVRPQVLCFALNGITAASEIKIMEEALSDGDNAVIELFYKPKAIADAISPSFDRLNSAASGPLQWLKDPFIALRTQVWKYSGDIPSVLLMARYDWLKASISQRTIHPSPPDPFNPPPLALGSAPRSIDFINDPLDNRALENLRRMATILRDRHIHALVYVTPFHPEEMSHNDIGRSPAYLANRQKLKAVFEQAGIPFVDYNEQFLPLKASDFYDNCHLQVSGCAILGAAIAEDWKKVHPP